MYARLLCIGLALGGCVLAFPQTTLRIMSYNVENLFYPEADSLHNDTEFTPDGARHWSFTRYRRKLSHIAEVIANVGGWDRPAVIGLQEVEELRCLTDLVTYWLRNQPYRCVLYEGPDLRGIDVGLIYDTTQLTLVSSRPIPVTLSDDERPTRDILYTCFAFSDTILLHVFTCHLPSQWGGHQASQARRKAALNTLSLRTDSLLALNDSACIVIMGDFNSDPQDCLPPMSNLMLPMAKAGKGTEKYHGYWACLDQIFVSPALLPHAQASICEAPFLLEPDKQFLGMRPRRTYQGFHYQKNGYSDHLPVILEWTPRIP